MQTLAFLPVPRHVEYHAGLYALEPGKRIVVDGFKPSDLEFSCSLLQSALRANANIDWTVAARSDEINAVGITCSVDSAQSNPQAYVLSIDEKGVSIRAGSAQGIFYGSCTLVQILEQSPHAIPFLRITDSPDFVDRGVMLDISRDKVPTMDTLYGLVDMLASWKINQLQLYVEHTFAYRNHRAVWQNASPLTASEVRDLDRYCRERFVALVPNQNSFGHMNRWLKHPAYRDLAEYPDPPMDSRWGREPFSLNPLDPRCLDLLRELYDELLPNFTDTRFNVGCDETFDLGMGRSREACKARGVGRVYLEFLQKVYREVKAREHTMMFWGDIVAGYPDLVPELPPDAVALEWGYEADHPFEERARNYAAAKIPFYLCPGTSSWNSIAGRTENAIGNIRASVENGHKYGAAGILNTDWGDNGHMQYLPVSFLGFAFGAAMSWCSKTNGNIDLPDVLDRFAFRDTARVMGRIAYELGKAHEQTELELNNSTILFHLLHTSIKQAREEVHGLTAESLQRTINAIGEAIAPVQRAKLTCADGSLIQREFASAAQWMQHAALRGQVALDAFDDVATVRRDLAADLDEELVIYKDLWHARNRPGGLGDSIARLRRIRQDYVD